MTKLEISKELIASCKSDSNKGKTELYICEYIMFVRANLLNKAISNFDPDDFDCESIILFLYIYLINIFV